MFSDTADSDSERTDAARLLSRGGRILAVAALAHIGGQRAGQGPWHTLPPETISAAEEILYLLGRTGNPTVLEAVVRAAMAPEPATAAPKWAKPLWREPSSISRLGSSIDKKRLVPALGPRYGGPSNREKGLAAVAVALCRSSDGLQALAERLPEKDGSELKRMASLAQALVEPKEPTAMRAEVRRLLKDME
jgi:hypothetical protein